MHPRALARSGGPRIGRISIPGAVTRIRDDRADQIEVGGLVDIDRGQSVGAGDRGGIEPGAVVFSIDGRLLGMALPAPDGIALVTPGALDAAVTELLGIGGSAP